MNTLASWCMFIAAVSLLPFITLGFVRKLKARLQNRIGPPLLQPFFNLVKLLGKDETVSRDASWLLRSSALINLAVILMVSCLVPWLSFKPDVPGADIFLVVYLLVSVRFFTILSSLDTGSPFGGFGASREATLSLLVEPAVILGLSSLALIGKSTSFNTIFSFAGPQPAVDMPVWLLAGGALFFSSLVELSRMPVDDPTTHLELTMVHEAMVIENSGRNLAMVELAYALRLVILYGLCGQCFLHALCCWTRPGADYLAIISVVAVMGLAAITAVCETVLVKLRWSRVPEFVAYAITMGMLAVMAAVLRGSG